MKQSRSYQDFKERTQEIFNFAVLITLSVPVLKQNLKLFTDRKINRLPDPDYFEPSVVYEIKEDTIDLLKSKGVSDDHLAKLDLLKDIPYNNKEFKLKVIDAIGEENYKSYRNSIKRQSTNYVSNILNCTSNYQSKLATYLYFSTFSYFEAFIIDISSEVINGFEKLDSIKYVKEFDANQETLNNMAKLDAAPDPKKKDRYKKFSSKIRESGYQTPEKLIFSSLADIYINKTESLKANEIPSFLEKTFFFKMTESEAKTFHSIRDNRNSIGHGAKSFSPHLNDVIKANKFFKRLSDRIDKHVRFYFFKLENYLPE